jgi:putative ABC transport system permease protein
MKNFNITQILAPITEAFSQALKAIWANRMRSFLTMLGIIIGVMSVVGMLTLIEGMNRSFASLIGELGSNSVYVSKFPAMSFGPSQRMYWRRPDLTEADAEAIQTSCPAVKSASAFLANIMDVRRGNMEMVGVSVIGTDDKYAEISNMEFESGRNLTAGDALANHRVAVIGADIIDNLIPDIDPIGAEIKIGGQQFTVIGTLVRKGKFFGESQDSVIYIPYGLAQTLFYGNRHSEMMLAIQAQSGAELKNAEDQLQEVLRRRRKLRFDEPNNFELITQDSLMETYNTITGAAFAVMIAVAGISLLVGGIGIMNIMLVTVTERTREIGIRKAVGAKRRDVLWQFLIEASSLSCIGGFLGILFGSLIGVGLCLLLSLPVFIPAWAAFLGFGFSAFVGIFFGLYPASKAARLDPIAALRYE